jgi:protein-L-isoaspartate(D-aspartate) O-methyltransferase
MVAARLLQLAQIASGDTVLEIGAASGYGTALLSRLARSVVAIEEVGTFCQQARARLKELAIGNAEVIEAPLATGYAARAPYDAIVFAGAVARIPEAIAAQLAEGGRLVAVLRGDGGTGRAAVMTRIGGVLSQRPVFDATVPLLPGFAAAASFVF